MNVSTKLAAGLVMLGVVGQSAANFSTNRAPWNISVARADSASVRAELVGHWAPVTRNGGTNPRGDNYTLRSNGTYTFKAGAGKRDMGNLQHSGTWRVANNGRTLRLHATRRVVLEGRRRRTLSANRNFALSVVGPNPSGTVTLNGQEFGS